MAPVYFLWLAWRTVFHDSETPEACQGCKRRKNVEIGLPQIGDEDPQWISKDHHSASQGLTRWTLVKFGRVSKYRWTSLSAVFLSANSLIHI
jgi:hypothetical protein